MLINDERFSCCCDWGTGRIGRAPAQVWYISLTGAEELRQINHGDGSERSDSTFTGAAQVVAMDSNNKFYTCSSAAAIVGSASGGAINLRRFAFDGTLDWTFAPGTVDIEADHIALDSSFNVYVAGSVLSGSRRDLKVYKVDNSGSEVWSFDLQAPATVPGTKNYQYIPCGICVDLNGKVHVTGRFVVQKPISTNFEIGHFEIHIDSDGNELWRDIYTETGSSALGNASGLQCAADEDGNVICIYDGNTTDDVTLKSYDSTGSVLFTATNPTFPIVSHFEYFNGSLYCTRRASLTQILIRKYSGVNFATLDWSDPLTFTFPPEAVPTAPTPRIAVDEEGNVYITYTTIISGTSVAYRRKVSGSDGSLIYQESISARQAIFPLVPPGRPIQFFS